MATKIKTEVKSSLLERIKKTSTIKESSVLTKSKFFTEKDIISTIIPNLNIALSGSLKGGLTPGLLMIAGPSKHFKTLFALIMAKSYMDKYPEAVLLFYDSEFGTPIGYFESLGIDKERVIHSPLTDIEALKFDIMAQLTEFSRDDKVIIVLDSIGNLASKKETDDALEKKSVADMTRAKQVKSLFRMVTPYLSIKDIPLVVVNHTYKEIGLFPRDIVGGGTGSYYSSDNIWIVGRQQDKTKGGELVGWKFIINIEKSRYVKEKSKIPIDVSFDGGISRWSGLLDLALEFGFVAKIASGNSFVYSKVDVDTGEVADERYKEDATDCKEFWDSILKNTLFNDAIETKYKTSTAGLIQIDVEEEVSTKVKGKK